MKTAHRSTPARLTLTVRTHVRAGFNGGSADGSTAQWPRSPAPGTRSLTGPSSADFDLY